MLCQKPPSFSLPCITSNKKVKVVDVNHVVELYPIDWVDFESRNEEDKKPTTIEELNSFQVGKEPHKCTKIRKEMDKDLKRKIEEVFKQFVCLKCC